MKILITENQLDKVIQSYIGKQISSFTESDWVDIDYEENLIKVWVNSSGRKMIKIVQYETLIVNYLLVHEVMEIFGIHLFKVDSEIKNWVFDNIKYDFGERVKIEPYL